MQPKDLLDRTKQIQKARNAKPGGANCNSNSSAAHKFKASPDYRVNKRPAMSVYKRTNKGLGMYLRGDTLALYA